MTDQSVEKNQIREKAQEFFAEKCYNPATVDEVAQDYGVVINYVRKLF